jgi:hypothetical protein
MGETLTVYATRLGTSTHQAMRVASPRASTVISGTVSSGGAQSPAGGVYLVNLTVRAGVRSGDVDLDISCADAYNRLVLIPVGSGTTGADSATLRGVRRGETQKTFSETVAEAVQDATVSRSAVSCLHGAAKGSEPETTGSFGLRGREPIQHLHPGQKRARRESRSPGYVG